MLVQRKCLSSKPLTDPTTGDATFPSFTVTIFILISTVSEDSAYKREHF